MSAEDGRSRILVVDDDPGMRRSVERVLSPLYRVDLAADAAEALQLAAANEMQVALVDVQLASGNDGYWVCHEIKRIRPDTDVILMTGSMSQPDEKLYRSLEEGAFYFLFKPFERRVLRALIERCLSLREERRAKEGYAKVLGADLEKARQFQRSLLPREPIRRSSWHVDGRFEPCEALGGDVFHTLVERDGSIVFAVSDIVGHGVSAAMYAGMLRSTLDAARRRDPDPARVMSELLGGIDFFESSRYATLFYGRLLPDGRMRYFNAGHPPALWRRADGTVERLGATGLLLSAMLLDRPRGSREIELAAGDRLLVYTDGVTEARDSTDRELGVDGLAAAFEAARELPAEGVADRLIDKVQAHCAGRPLTDDATLMLIEREPASGAS